MTRLTRLTYAGLVVVLFSAALASTASADDYVLQQVILDCKPNTVATAAGHVLDVRCPPFAPSVVSVSSATGRPVVQGVYDAVHATAPGLTVTVDAITYTLGVNSELTTNGDLWTLDLSQLATALSPGTHTVTVTAPQAATTPQGTGTITVPTPVAPTVNPLETITTNPIISGTFDPATTKTLTVTVDGRTYTLGVDAELTANGTKWQLNLNTRPLAAGNYSVNLSALTFTGQTLKATAKLTILPLTPLTIITHPSDNLANTGVSAMIPLIMSMTLIAGGVYLLKKSREEKLHKNVLVMVYYGYLKGKI